MFFSQVRYTNGIILPIHATVKKENVFHLLICNILTVCLDIYLDWDNFNYIVH